MKTLEEEENQREILARIAALTSSDRAKWGRMSVDQMICHLRDSYGLALGEKSASPASGFLQRTLLKWAALWIPMRWGKNFPTRPEMDQSKGGTRPVDFERDRSALA